MDKVKYCYDGPVFRFDKVYQERLVAFCMAVSVKEALNNIAFRYKKQNGFAPGAKIELYQKYLTIVTNKEENKNENE